MGRGGRLALSAHSGEVGGEACCWVEVWLSTDLNSMKSTIYIGQSWTVFSISFVLGRVVSKMSVNWDLLI